jgi:hypothetical protein
VKAFDGGYWFDQGLSFRDVCRCLKARDIGVGGWGYLYGENTAAEASRAIETAQYGEADFLVLDVESEFKGHPEAAADVCQRIRVTLGPDYPLYFSSFALARYHQSFPFEAFRRYCTGTAPQVYWNAFRWPLEQALGWTYEDYAGMQIPPAEVFPVGGLYQEGAVTYPTPQEVRDFAREAARRGSRGVSFWSYEHMDDAMWQAVASAALAGGEEAEMSSQEYEQLSQQLVAVGARVAPAVGGDRAQRWRCRPAACASAVASAAHVHRAVRRHALRFRGEAGPRRLAGAVSGERRRDRRRPEQDLSGAGAGVAVGVHWTQRFSSAVRGVP